MSRNAYKVKRIVTAKSPSFNLVFDEELEKIIDVSANLYDYLNANGFGIFEILDDEFKEVKKELEEVIKGLESNNSNKKEDREKAEHYREVLKEMEREIKKEGYISYEIY